MSDVWGMIAAERTALADELAGLTDEQWRTPSLCTGWTISEVAVHLGMGFHVSTPSFLWRMACSGFDFDKVADKYARSSTATTAERAADLRANAEHRFHPPGFGPEAPLTDVVVHGQDIRRPLGLAHGIAPDRARVVLDLLSSPKGVKAFGHKGLLDGLRLDATDTDWSTGSGDVVSGTADALIVTLAGRPAALDELSGPGADTLRSRL